MSSHSSTFVTSKVPARSSSAVAVSPCWPRRLSKGFWLNTLCWAAPSFVALRRKIMLWICTGSWISIVAFGFSELGAGMIKDLITSHQLLPMILPWRRCKFLSSSLCIICFRAFSWEISCLSIMWAMRSSRCCFLKSAALPLILCHIVIAVIYCSSISAMVVNLGGS